MPVPPAVRPVPLFQALGVEEWNRAGRRLKLAGASPNGKERRRRQRSGSSEPRCPPGRQGRGLKCLHSSTVASRTADAQGRVSTGVHRPTPWRPDPHAVSVTDRERSPASLPVFSLPELFMTAAGRITDHCQRPVARRSTGNSSPSPRHPRRDFHTPAVSDYEGTTGSTRGRTTRGPRTDAESAGCGASCREVCAPVQGPMRTDCREACAGVQGSMRGWSRPVRRSLRKTRG